MKKLRREKGSRANPQVVTAPSLPSKHLPFALEILKLGIEEKRKRRWVHEADSFHITHCPGKPSITMAAIVRMGMPFVDRESNILINRETRKIAQAFDCSESSLRERMVRIRTEG
jgi:hypothetical protein